MQDALFHALPNAFDTRQQSITIADATAPDMQLVYVNPGFEDFCGYSREAVIGRNCRFLQTPPFGPRDRPADVESVCGRIREALTSRSDCVVDMPNYRKTGERMINRFSLRPVFDQQQTLRYYIGLQTDLTLQKDIEQSIFEYIQQRLIANA